MTYYKVTDERGQPFHGGTGRWVLGEWREVNGPLVPCQHGLHLCTLDHLLCWLGPVISEAEIEGEWLDAGDKIVARRARITRRVTTWTAQTARLFAADCAEHVLPVWEVRYPDDIRPRHAIETARRYAVGQATDDELLAARAAVGDAAWAAAWVAARVAAGAAARAAAGAARDAARAAAWAAWAAGDAAGDAARAAAWAAWAAGDAAGAAAWVAARVAGAAAWAARDGERAWQTDRLRQYLDGQLPAPLHGKITVSIRKERPA